MLSAFTYRPALDGLRAVAVLSVIVYHVSESWLPGGFLGVDIFFVLSGFLITSLLLVEYDNTKTIRLSKFWSRRARRLLPAIVVLVVVIAIVEHQTIAETALRASRRKELLATLFYGANWFFILTGRSYFADYAGASPVRHTWSLAIEEQFYLLFPLVMTFGLRMKRRWLQVAMVVVLGLSAWLMAGLYTPSNPTRAYYGTDARIHQLLAGALLALLLSGRYRNRIIKAARRVVPLTALALLAAFFLIRDDGSFYYSGGAVGVGLATAALVAGLEDVTPVGRALSTRPMVALGKISYGMYLWHFPIVVWLLRLTSMTPGALLGAVLSLTLLASAVSYAVVERPIRVDQRLFRLKLTPRRLAYVVPVVSVVAAVSIVVALPDSEPEWAREDEAAPAAVRATELPSTTVVSPGEPSLASVVPEAPTRIAIVGDSFMVSAYPGFRTVAEETGRTLVEAAFPACPIGEEPLASSDGEIHFKAEQCNDLVAVAYEWLAEEPVDVVLWHDLQSVLPRFAQDGSVLQPGTLEWQTDLMEEWSRVLDGFLNTQTTVVIIEPPLRSQDVDCDTSQNEQRCIDIREQDEFIRSVTERFSASMSGREDVVFVTVDDLLCPSGVPCPASIDGVIVREGGTDQTHFTEEGSLWFARKLLDRVDGLLKDL